MQFINPEQVLAPQGGYSNSVVSGDLIFVAGQVGVDAQMKFTGSAGMADQTRQTLANIEAILKAAHAGLEDVVSATVFVSDFAAYKEFDRVWTECFGAHRPARATVRAELVLPQLLVEIQVIARRPANAEHA
ncbi:MAG: RidA family protein [Variovorax sp.]|nr:MAG: RidA family protein [Variovorax sp.]